MDRAGKKAEAYLQFLAMLHSRGLNVSKLAGALNGRSGRRRG